MTGRRRSSDPSTLWALVMLRRFALTLTSVSLLITGAAAHPRCPEDSPIRFAHCEFGLLYSADTGTGIDDEVQQELARRSGCQFEVSLRPRARIWVDLQSSALDMAGSGVQTPARNAFAWFAHYVLEDNHVVLADFIARPELKMGGVRSFSYSPCYDEHVERLRQAGRIDFVDDTGARFRMFSQAATTPSSPRSSCRATISGSSTSPSPSASKTGTPPWPRSAAW